MSTHVRPSYDGSGLVNLVASIEHDLIGSAPAPVLGREHPFPAAAAGQVLVLFDGLGSHQLAHPLARTLQAAEGSVIHAGFPTMTSVSLATVATGLNPGDHGLIGYVLRLDGVRALVNTLRWIEPHGPPIPFDYPNVLPSPNLWERLRAAGVEPITIQPGPFVDSPLTHMLYRGCRFEGYWNVDELIDATVQLAGPGRFVFSYFPSIDQAAHMEGQASDAYAEALVQGTRIWEAIAARLDPALGLTGTADHGHIDCDPPRKHRIRDRRWDPLDLFGQSRALFARGPIDLIDDLAAEYDATVHTRSDLLELLGGSSFPDLSTRLPDRLILANDHEVLLARPFDDRLIGYHGGLAPEEVEIPLLVRH